MTEARYDAVADFYQAGWTDSYDDPQTGTLLELTGNVDGLRVLDVACGHGRISRELARRGARVTGVDISGAQLANAQRAEAAQPLGIRYAYADIAAADLLPAHGYDLAVCAFGLSDIDDLAGAVATVARVLRPGAAFVFSILHPCFPGSGEVSGAWPAGGTYWDEGWWAADGGLSTLRRRVGANHRTLTTYLNALRGRGLWLDHLAEPPPGPDWAGGRAEAARHPVFLVARCRVGADGTGPLAVGAGSDG
jgi:SAM-dependent methyltransferase